MKLTHVTQREVREALESIPEIHRLGVKIVVNALCTVGGSISPQRDLVPTVREAFDKHGLTALDEKKLTEYIRKYERAGFFKRGVHKTDKRKNVLEVTPLGRALVATIERDLSAVVNQPKISWVPRTKWLLETMIRQKRSLSPGEPIELAQLSSEVLAKREQFGLNKLFYAATAEEFIRTVIKERFGDDELKIDENTKTIRILRALK